MKKGIIFSTIASIAIIVVIVVLLSRSNGTSVSGTSAVTGTADIVSSVNTAAPPAADQKSTEKILSTQNNTTPAKAAPQIIEITAKGGYQPTVLTAKAGIPTIIRVSTAGTFDCSSALNIPAIQYRGQLPASGVTDIQVPPQQAGTKLQGICAMGMYSFAVNFN